MATAKKNVVAMNPDVSKQIDALREDVALLATSVKSLTKTKVADTKERVIDTAQVKSEQAKAKYDELTTNAEKSIKDNPLTSVAIAAGIGLLFGALTRR